MPSSLILFFSQTGSTARVAEAVAAGLRAAQWQVDLHDIVKGPPPDVARYDLLGLGSPAYFFRPPFNVLDAVRGLPRLDGKGTFVLLTHGTYPGDAGNALRSALSARGGQELGYWRCRGADRFLGYLQQGALLSADHPTPGELAEAQAFGGHLAARWAGQPGAVPPRDPPAAALYRLERFLTNRRLVRHFYSRLFTVDPGQCNACGLCQRLCPTGNIARARAGLPAWGRDCLLCLTCQMRCPREAIGSPVTWPVFTPFMALNVRLALRDPALDYVRVSHRDGRTEPL
jgi:flavodoxin/Pyruvate/2-oxoacid:ferredoxin oxidoreductase delta subunit